MSKVMLVEDDNNLREIYEARLRAEGYDIVSAHDGEEALVVAKAEKPELIIADVMMPKISGFEMLDIMRNTDGLRNVKVIMLTALGQSDDQQRAKNLGADRYLVKSQVTLEDIVKAAHELLEDQGTGSAAPEVAAAATPTPTPSAAPAPAPTAATPAPTAPASEPPTPSPTPTETPAAPAPASDTPKDDVKSDAKPVVDAAASDDKVMTDAVNDLIAATEAAETEPKAEAPKDSEGAPSHNTKKEDEPTKKEAPEPPKKDETPAKSEDNENPFNGHVKIANKKVIQPIDSGPEKNIQALLAEEEAKETASTPGATTEPKSETKTEAAAAPTAKEEAEVEAKIEDFVAGATTEPDTPQAQPPKTENAAAKQSSDSKPTPDTSAPSTPAAVSSTPKVTPIVISEDAPSGAPPSSISGNPGVPPAAPDPASSGPDSPAKPADPGNIAL